MLTIDLGGLLLGRHHHHRGTNTDYYMAGCDAGEPALYRFRSRTISHTDFVMKMRLSLLGETYSSTAVSSWMVLLLAEHFLSRFAYP